MKITRLIIIILPITIFILSCNDNDSPNNSGTAGPTIIVNTTFEGLGKGDFQGWLFREVDVSASKYFTFSNNVPASGDSWSLMILPDTTTRRHLYYKAILPTNSSPKVMSVKFDLKTVGQFMGTLDCKMWSKSVSDGWSGGYGKYLEWGTSSNLFDISVSNIDSIVFDLGMYKGRIGDTLFVDNIRIELYSN